MIISLTYCNFYSQVFNVSRVDDPMVLLTVFSVEPITPTRSVMGWVWIFSGTAHFHYFSTKFGSYSLAILVLRFASFFCPVVQCVVLLRLYTEI